MHLNCHSSCFAASSFCCEKLILNELEYYFAERAKLVIVVGVLQASKANCSVKL
jgi:hypothetical protein